VFWSQKFGLLISSVTFSVVAEAHLGLAEANGVLAGADAIELLELCLVDALQSSGQRSMLLERRPYFGSGQSYLAGHVKLNGLDTDVLGPL
jgi:hypothetical protein